MSFHLEIITAERVLFQGDVDSVIAPGSEGELGVLPHHAAVMTTLKSGELRYLTEGVETYFALTGGFMDIRGDQIVVLADAAEHVDEIDETRAEEAARRAQERIAARAADIDLERALRSLQRAQVRVQTTRRRRRRGAGAQGPAQGQD
jgi:F-type H+-transporting ATPase subunit epsilon